MPESVCPPRRMRFSFESRCRIVQLILEGTSPRAAAAACGASRATGYRLWRRFQEGGWAALADRPPVPLRQPRRLSAEAEAEILAARSYANAGPVIVAGLLGRPASTVWKVLRRYGVSRLPRLPREPVQRYERERPGELVHVDIKRLGRFWTVGKAILGDRLTRSGGPAGSTCTSRSTTTHDWPTASCSQQRARPTRRLPPPRTRLVHRSGPHDRTRPQRQRQRLPLPRLDSRLPRARHPAPPHASASPANQRQGRSARQDPPARMGLPLRLPQQHPPRQSPRRLPPLVQPPPTTRLARRPTTNQPRLTGLWDP